MSYYQKTLRKIKVIGFPFAVDRLAQGTAETPLWLSSQRWFRKLKHVEYETVNTTPLNFTADSPAEQLQTILQNNLLLKKHTYQAFKEGCFPLIVGGDNSQTLGAVLGMKKFRPAAKTIILDAKIDLDMQNDGQYSSLEQLVGARQNGQYKCLDLTSDIAFVGAHSKHAAYDYLSKSGGILVGRYHVLYQDTSCIHNLIHRKLSQNKSQFNDLWISCSLDVLDSSQFMSQQKCFFGSEDGDGVPLDFVTGFIRSLSEECIGLDLCDVNFEITQSDDQLRSLDFETFRELFEHIVESIHGRHLLESSQEQAFKPIKLVVSRPGQTTPICPKPKNTKLKSTKEIVSFSKKRHSTAQKIGATSFETELKQ